MFGMSPAYVWTGWYSANRVQDLHRHKIQHLPKSDSICDITYASHHTSKTVYFIEIEFLLLAHFSLDEIKQLSGRTLKTPIHKRGCIDGHATPSSTRPSQAFRNCDWVSSQITKHPAWEMMIMFSARLANHHHLITHVRTHPMHPSYGCPTNTVNNEHPKIAQRSRKAITSPQIHHPGSHATSSPFLPTPSWPLSTSPPPRNPHYHPSPHRRAPQNTPASASPPSSTPCSKPSPQSAPSAPL